MAFGDLHGRIPKRVPLGREHASAGQCPSSWCGGSTGGCIWVRWVARRNQKRVCGRYHSYRLRRGDGEVRRSVRRASRRAQRRPTGSPGAAPLRTGSAPSRRSAVTGPPNRRGLSPVSGVVQDGSDAAITPATTPGKTHGPVVIVAPDAAFLTATHGVRLSAAAGSIRPRREQHRPGCPGGATTQCDRALGEDHCEYSYSSPTAEDALPARPAPAMIMQEAPVASAARPSVPKPAPPAGRERWFPPRRSGHVREQEGRDHIRQRMPEAEPRRPRVAHRSVLA